jgi:phenylalanyl-tRNA synthetase beta chain
LDAAIPVIVFELDLAPLQQAMLPQFRMPSKFSSVRRDLALLVPEEVSADAVMTCVRAVESEGLLREVFLFDVYQGEHLQAGKKSLAIALQLQSDLQTLQDEEVEAVVQNVVKSLANELNIELRS